MDNGGTMTDKGGQTGTGEDCRYGGGSPGVGLTGRYGTGNPYTGLDFGVLSPLADWPVRMDFGHPVGPGQYRSCPSGIPGRLSPGLGRGAEGPNGNRWPIPVNGGRTESPGPDPIKGGTRHAPSIPHAPHFRPLSCISVNYISHIDSKGYRIHRIHTNHGSSGAHGGCAMMGQFVPVVSPAVPIGYSHRVLL